MATHDELVAAAARNYMLRVTEASRVTDEEYDADAALTPQQIETSFAELQAAAADTVILSTPSVFRAIREDGHIVYRRPENMTVPDIEAALIALAAERACLARVQKLQTEDFALLLRLREQLQAPEAETALAARPEVVALLVDLDPKGNPESWAHADGKPVTPEEIAIVKGASFLELRAARDHSKRTRD